MEKKRGEISPLVIELKKLIEEYLAYKSSKGGLFTFSKEFNIPFSTLRRIVNLQTTEDPLPSTVLSVVSAIYQEKSIRRILQLVNGEISEILKKNYGLFGENKDDTNFQGDVVPHLMDRDSYIIYRLSLNCHGVSLGKLHDLLGASIWEKIGELKEIGLIYEKEGVLHGFHKNVILPDSLSKMFIHDLIHILPKESHKNSFSLISESVSLKAFEKILEIHKKSVQEINKIISNEENHGDIPVISISLVNSFNDQK